MGQSLTLKPSGTASIHPQIVPKKVFHQWEKVYSSFTAQYTSHNKLNTKKEGQIKFELLEDDNEPQLFKFYIHPERKYNINKDYTVQN